MFTKVRFEDDRWFARRKTVVKNHTLLQGADLLPSESLGAYTDLSEKRIKSSSVPKFVPTIKKPETELIMARGSKKKYTSKQKRKASKIERGYKKRGVSSKEAERRAWATVNKSDRGGRKKGGGGRGKKRSKSSSRKGGRKGGRR